MNLKSTSVTAGLAALALVASSVAALASPAVATGSVNVRTGPGINYSRIDTLYPGERVDVQQCKGSWCYVIKSGADGWVSSNYLASANAPRPSYNENYAPPPPSQVYPRPTPVYPRPQQVYPRYGNGYYNYNYNYGYSNPGFCVGSNNSYFCLHN